MKAQDSAKRAGSEDHKKGIPLNRNPFQYTSNIFKQAAWAAGWNEAERQSNVDWSKEKA